MKTVHIYSNRHIKDQVHNIHQGDVIWLDNSLSQKRWSLFFKYNDINEDKLKLTYVGNNELERIDMKDTIIVGNPPYNDGSKGRAPIYDKFLEKLAKVQPKKITFIIPTNWFSQPHTKLGKDVRRFLKELGVYKIEINPIDLFETATVGTCTVFCERNYRGNISLGTNNDNFFINDFDETILPFDTVTRNLLNRLKPSSPYTTHSGNKGNTNQWRIMTSYRKERFDIDPLNPLKVFEPNYKSQGGYRVFCGFDSEILANEYLEYYSSFWHSKLIKFILRKTRNSTTLDNPQITWVPKVVIDHKFTDTELYRLFNLSNEEIEKVEDDARKYN